MVGKIMAPVMRRLLGFILSVALVAFGGAVALASARTSATRLVVCPLRASVVEPCCGPIVATARAAATIPCCDPPRTDCTTSLTFAASRNPAVAGQRIKLTGTLSSAVSGSTVELWQKPAGASAFKEVAHTTTGSSGKYSFTRKLETNVRWYASVGTVDSGQWSESVGAKLTLRQIRASPTRVTLRGHVSPDHAGARVTIEKRTGSGWAVIARVRLNRSSRFTFSYDVPLNGTATVRLIVPASKRNVRSTLVVHTD
jgi:hypothetical protein